MTVLARRVVLSLVLLALIAVAFITFSYETVPSSDTAATHFDCIIVLGTPSELDGSPSPEQLERVLEGVQQFRAGVAPHVIMTGGPAHNHFVEAHTMAVFAKSLGVPADAVLEENRAQNTVQNIWYSSRLMQEHGWRSAEVVSSPSHLPRTALILEHYRFPWRTDAAHWPPEYTLRHRLLLFWGEALYSTRLRWLGFKTSPFLPNA